MGKSLTVCERQNSPGSISSDFWIRKRAIFSLTFQSLLVTQLISRHKVLMIMNVCKAKQWLGFRNLFWNNDDISQFTSLYVPVLLNLKAVSLIPRYWKSHLRAFYSLKPFSSPPALPLPHPQLAIHGIPRIRTRPSEGFSVWHRLPAPPLAGCD